MRKSSAAKISFVEPMYAEGVRSLPEGPDWLYEIKFNGYRCIAAHDANGVRLWSRRGNPLTSQFSTIAAACKKLPRGTVVDGEVVAIDSAGRMSFNLLQHHRDRAAALRYYLFDVLVYRGKNLMDRPLSERRLTLAKLEPVTGPHSALVLSDAFDASVEELIGAFTETGLEGVIAKRRDSRYESGERTGRCDCTCITKRSIYCYCRCNYCSNRRSSIMSNRLLVSNIAQLMPTKVSA